MTSGGGAFELHMDVRPALLVGRPAYLMLLETPLIYLVDIDAPKHYQKVFTWDDARVGGDRYIKFNYPNPMAVPALDGFTHRERFCCLIAGNKSPIQHDVHELYSERVRVIRWFEKNAPEDFDLYGTDWDLPPARSGLPGRVKRRLWRQLLRLVRMKPFPSYRGKVKRKLDVLRRRHFSTGYENICDMSVYWGENIASDQVSSDSYIDWIQFTDTTAEHLRLNAMNQTSYIGYQQRIALLLNSYEETYINSETFAEMVVSTIVQDHGCIA